jgi:TatD DNase family protein
MVLTDTHCHLNFDSFDADREAVVVRAQSEGVARILNPAIDLETSRAAVALAEQYPAVYAAVGVHPNDSTGWQATWLDELRALARHPKVVAIGEIGLDDYWDAAPFDHQQRVFQQQLDLAAELGLPVVVHVRDKQPPGGPAIENVIAMLTDWQNGLELGGSPLAQRPGVLHSFSGDLAAAQRAVAAHFLIGITGPVTFKKADTLREVVAGLPAEVLLIETDAPFLTPHPYRGQRNEPAYVRFVAEKIAAVRQIELQTLAPILSANSERLFHWQGTLPHR